MSKIIGVRFKEVGKIYYFDPEGFEPQLGEFVIVETSRGIECGQVAMAATDVDDEQIVKPLKPVIRRATDDDLLRLEKNKQKEKEIFALAFAKIEAHKLPMKLIAAETTFDSAKHIFYFTADGRVDFRELVRDLAGAFRTRIELRQIGVRDQAKMLGGLGICGRPYCCSSYMGSFVPVSIRMAKEQGLSLNPVKISGCCGRLMCCLKYEQNAYEYLLKTTPKAGALVETPEGRGIVAEVNLLTGKLKINLDSKPGAAPAEYHKSKVNVLRDGQIKIDKAEMEALKGLEE
jgi:cell fate regulator YaaT (PSP1 superfamily)